MLTDDNQSWTCDLCGSTVPRDPVGVFGPEASQWGYIVCIGRVDIDVCFNCKKLTKVLKDIANQSWATFTGCLPGVLK